MPETTPAPSRKRTANQVSAGGGNAVYGLGLIGALVYFWQQADSLVDTCSPSSRHCCGRRFWSTRRSSASTADQALGSS